MMARLAVAVAVLACTAVLLQSADARIRAGVSRVNATLPTGVPLAGYNHGDRQAKDWPIPKNTKYTSFMAPSVGHLTPTWIRCLALDDGNERYYFVTVDAIGADGTLRRLGVTRAQAKGTNATLDNVLLHASHSHSGPGAVSPDFVWQMAPATDLLVPQLQEMLAESMAEAIFQAEQNMTDAQIGIDSGILTNVTVNRRAGISPYLNPNSIDPHLGVIRVDDMNGNPMATVWNYAIHGTCWGPSQMMSNGDIMGGVNEIIEDKLGLGFSFFINADAGDIDPSSQSCENKPDYQGSPTIANAVAKIRKGITPTKDMTLHGASEIVDFGPATINYTLSRFANCTSGGPLDICTLCRILKCDLNLDLGTAWLESLPRFTAVRFSHGDDHTLLVTMPGEPLSELGFQVRNDSASMGFTRTLLAGYSQNHMGYFATPDEYEVGGYESQLTFWGIDTAEHIRAGCKAVASKVTPSN